MKKFILAALATTTIAAALPTVALAESANSVTVTKFHQSYPYSGKATVEYTVATSATLPANAVAEITITTDNASATFVQSNIVAGANSHVIDFASSFGGALLLTNASFVVTITGGLGGVQLWENGPYWAECNVGATKPEEYGYYFWWGDTVGYTNTGSGWISVKDGTSISFSSSGTAASTYGMNNSALRSAGYIDYWTNNLVEEHDAATAHLGSPWRMPKDSEISALVRNCTTTWITTNGVSGCLVTGKDDYANRSIFLPAAGFGNDSYLIGPGSDGYYWSSTPVSPYTEIAFYLYFYSGSFYESSNTRIYGQSVRPVRGFAECGAGGIVTYDSSPYETWAAANGVAGAWDATDASGIANVFRYVFNVPTGAFTNPPLLDIEIEGGNAVVITPPVSNTVGFAVSVVESSDVAGATVTRRKPLDATGRTVFPMGSAAASRFYRLSATEGDASPGGVQLWENGPYWAECNVGASEPEEHGYYFWWGDTVGYLQSGGTWYSFGFYSSVTWVSSTGEQMSSSPFSPSSCPTYGKVDSELLSAGYIDSTGNLAPEYDAATAHLGAPWRMPTDAEFAALTNNCTATWTTTNGVRGCLVTGKGAYADRSIFLPTAGYGSDSTLGSPNSQGYYWSSTPDSEDSHFAWHLYFNSNNFRQYIYYGRQYGLSVRPVRDAD